MIKHLYTNSHIKSYNEILKVNLVSYSKAVEDYEMHSDIEKLIVYCARVSAPANQNNIETATRLINYLKRNRHWSPFEMVNVCLEITTTRDIARQLLRHRSFSFQEFSQRYADPTQELEFCIKECRLQDKTNRQNSIECEDAKLNGWWEGVQLATIDTALTAYTMAIQAGVAKEVARSVLPEGNTVSRLYVNGTIRSWIHYLDVRATEGSGTQKEHKLMALACAKAISKVFNIAN